MASFYARKRPVGMWDQRLRLATEQSLDRKFKIIYISYILS